MYMGICVLEILCPRLLTNAVIKHRVEPTWGGEDTSVRLQPLNDRIKTGS